MKKLISFTVVLATALPSSALAKSFGHHPVTPSNKLWFEEEPTEPTPPGCDNWKVSMTYDAAVEEYIKAHKNKGHIACVQKYLFHAGQQLTNPIYAADYEGRLQKLNDRHETSQDAAEKTAIEDLFVHFQHKWISEVYQQLDLHGSTAVKAASGVGAFTIAAITVVAIISKRPFMKQISENTRGLGMRMAKHTGSFILRNSRVIGVSAVASSTSFIYRKSGNSGADSDNFELSRPPMDIFDGDNDWFKGYKDLHFFRDLITASTNQAAWVTTALAAEGARTMFYWWAGKAGTAAKAGLKFNLITFALGYYAGAKFEGLMEDYLTADYHQTQKTKVEELGKQLRNSKNSDWKTFLLAEHLSHEALKWVSTQDVALEQEILGLILDHSRSMICTRLNNRATDEAVLENWPQHSLETVKSSFFNEILARKEKELRENIATAVAARADRLRLVKAGIEKSRANLLAMKSDLVKDAAVEHQAYIQRINRHLGTNLFAESEINAAREMYKLLAPGAELWKNTEALQQIGEEYNCR